MNLKSSVFFILVVFACFVLGHESPAFFVGASKSFLTVFVVLGAAGFFGAALLGGRPKGFP